MLSYNNTNITADISHNRSKNIILFNSPDDKSVKTNVSEKTKVS